MKQPIKQMLIAGAIGGVIIATGFTLVGIGTAKEQREQTEHKEHKTAPAIVMVCEAATVEERYFDAVPLDKGLQDYIIRESESKGIDPAIVMALIDRESEYKADTIGDNGNSFGLCQIMRKWHTERMDKLGCTDLLDPYHNVTVCIDYLAELLDRYDGDVAKALVAYNQGHYKGTVTEYAEAVLKGASDLNAYSR